MNTRRDHPRHGCLIWCTAVVLFIGWLQQHTVPVSVEAWTPSTTGNSQKKCLISCFRTRGLFVSRSPNDASNDSVRNSDDNNDDNKDDDSKDKRKETKKEDHMSIVRQLQDSFYKSAPSTPPCRLDAESSMVHNLPILTWPWHEVPGRSNVLHVHEGTYTHLLETVLRSNPPVWYLGHVYRHGPQTKRRLYSWKEDDKEKQRPEYSEEELLRENHRSQDTVLGTLLRITDYRRMADGRLLVLVQAMERFAVHNVTQSAPFCVADVQLLPDSTATFSRAESCVESFGKWHRYEFEQTMLPLPFGAKKKGSEEQEHYLDNSQIVGSAMAQVLPYAAFSSVVNVERLNQEPLPPLASDKEESIYDPLLRRGILIEPSIEMDVKQMSCDELEYALWVCLDKYLKQTKRAVSPVLLGLLPLPPGSLTWPKNFVLERIVTAIQEQNQLNHKCVRVSPFYPAHRRQYRLSYAAAAVLERDEYQAQEWRLQLLQIPTTQQRLAFVLQHLRAKTEGGVFQ